MDITQGFAKGEAVEHELDAMIRRRDSQRRQSEEQQRVEDAWAPSVRAHHERQEAARRAERHEYHSGQADRLRRTMGELIARHEAAAERYLQDEPKGAA